MLIDWFTVAAQVVNFLILVWLLKHFLYDRIIKAIDQREASIAGRFQEAEQREEAARRREQEVAAQEQELEAQGRQVLEQAKLEAAQRREELVAQAKQEVEGRRGAWQQSLQRDQQALAADLARMAAQGAGRLSRQALQELADTDTNQRSLEVFLAKLAGLDQEAREQLRNALSAASPLLVRSAFELDQAQKERLAQALGALGGSQASLEFENDPDLLLGLEIRLPGRKLAWSLDEYLEEVGRQVEQRLERALRGLADQEAGAKQATAEESRV